MKIKLKDGKYIDVEFWSFAWKSFLAQSVFGIVIWLILIAVSFAIFGTLSSIIK